MKWITFALLTGTALAAGWKDRAEYDLVLELREDASAQKRIELLDGWKARYPASEFQQMRQELYLTSYDALGDTRNMLRVAREMLKSEPDNRVGLYWST